MSKILQTVIVLTAVTAFYTAPQSAVAGEQKSILVTGASTGIGRNLTETLAAKVITSTPARVRIKISRH